MTAKKNHSPPRRAQANLLLMIGALLFAFTLAEGVLRADAYIKNGFTQLDGTFMIDAASGLRVPRPAMAYKGIHINTLGFRGPEIISPKPANTIRLAFLGASTTFCAEVSNDSTTWPDIVTRDLKQRFLQSTFDYINAGVPGYAINSMQKMLEYRVRSHTPDLVVIYEVANSLASDTRQLAADRNIVSEKNRHWYIWLVDRSRVAYLIYMNAVIWDLRNQDRSGMRHRLELGQQELDMLRARYRDRMVSLIRTAQQSSRLVAVATFSFRVRHDNMPPAGSAEAAWMLYNARATHLTIAGLVAAFDAYNAAIRDAAAATGAVLIEGEFDIPGDARHFVDSMHFTDAGSSAMARRVTERLAVAPEFQRLLQDSNVVMAAPARVLTTPRNISIARAAVPAEVHAGN
jgi:lysophospholipase L1-like esterase